MTVRVRAVESARGFISRDVQYIIEMTHADVTRMLCWQPVDAPVTARENIDPDVHVVAWGWFAHHEIPEQWRTFLLQLPRDVALAVGEKIVEEFTGVSHDDGHILRSDLDHERRRRDIMEDALLLHLARFTSHMEA